MSYTNSRLAELCSALWVLTLGAAPVRWVRRGYGRLQAAVHRRIAIHRGADRLRAQMLPARRAAGVVDVYAVGEVTRVTQSMASYAPFSSSSPEGHAVVAGMAGRGAEDVGAPWAVAEPTSRLPTPHAWLPETKPVSGVVQARDLAAVEDGLIRPPRNGRVAYPDVAVRGGWERNPNTHPDLERPRRTPIIQAQRRTLIDLLLSANPEIQGPPDLVERAKKWWEIEMPIETGYERSLDHYIRTALTSMLDDGVALVVKQRTQSPERRPFKDPVTGALRAPVFCYHIPGGSTIEAFIDTKGRFRKWRQNPALFENGNPPVYRDDDVRVLRLPTNATADAFWTPSLVVPALYPITVLHALQEALESHTRGIVDIKYYVRVGHPDVANGKVTPGMIDEMARAFRTTRRGEVPVVPHWATVEDVEPNSYVDDLTNAAKYWEQEARRAIGGNQLTDGVADSGTRNTSIALEDRDLRSASVFAPVLADGFHFLMVDKLLEWAEAGEIDFDLSKITSKKDIPHLVFSEIDQADRDRRETSATNKFLSGGIRHQEYRSELGYEDPETNEHAEKFWFEIQTEQAADAARATAEAAAKMNPENQHGKQTKPKQPKDALQDARRSRGLSWEDDTGTVHGA